MSTSASQFRIPMKNLLEFGMQTLQKVKQAGARRLPRIPGARHHFLRRNTCQRYFFSRSRSVAFHHARWMAKAIYCLKIYLFRSEFTLTKEEKLGFGKFASFLPNFISKFGFNLHWLQKLFDWN